MGDETSTNIITIKDNLGDHTKKGEGNIRYANLLIGGKKNETPRILLPCLRGLQNQRPYEIIIKFGNPIALETEENRKQRFYSKGIELARKALDDNPDFHPDIVHGIRDYTLFALLGISHRTNVKDIDNFYRLLNQNRDSIIEYYRRYPEYHKELEKSKGIKLPYEPVETIIEKKFPDFEDKELLEAVIEKVIDEQKLAIEQAYSDKIIDKLIKDIKKKIKSYSGRKHGFGKTIHR